MKKLIIGTATVLLLAGAVVFAQQTNNKTMKKENCEMLKKDNCPNHPGCICTPKMMKNCTAEMSKKCAMMKNKGVCPHGSACEGK